MGNRASFVYLALPIILIWAAPGKGDSVIAYKPDIVGVNRMFMVALRLPVDAPQVKVTVPDSVEMFDQTRLPARSDIRKYYFRSLKPTKQADIVFALPAGSETVSIEIWSFDDLREYRMLKGVQLPRRWPLGKELPELKAGQTITTQKMKDVARGASPRGDQWLKLSDNDIWSLQTDSTIPRWHWVNVLLGCPIHGAEIYTKGAYYPWLDELSRPIRTYTQAAVPYAWKLKCPVGGELLPSNDFANGDMTSGDFPDDAFGGGVEHKGNRYGIIAEMNQSYCHKLLNVAPLCADGYLTTGDIQYVHKALVAMCRLAVEYAYLATMTQHRHRNSQSQVERLGPAPFSEGPCLVGSGFTVYCIDQPGYQWGHAEAYDKIFPSIEQDEAILPFMRSKGYDIKDHRELRRFIEENLFAVWMQGAMDLATRSNEPYHQRGMARMAESLNYRSGADFMDWLYDGEGKMRTFVTNEFFRDGSPYESTGGYNGMHVVAMGPIIESIEHLRKLRPDTYPDDKYPNLTRSRRYHSVFDYSMDTINIDRTYSRIGDDGAHPRYAKRGKRVWQNGGAAAFEHAYGIFKDPKFAWALANTPGWSPSLEFPYSREEVEAAAAKWPAEWNDASCLKDGYGVAMLRSGKDDNKRSFWMMYGRPRGHTHDDMLHIGLDAYASEILGHLGYPRNWSAWEGNWITQINARQVPFVSMTATPQLFADAGPVHVAEAFAQPFEDRVGSGEGYRVPEDNWQRRLIATVDVSDESFYCIDLYRIFGGKEHWWSLHAQEGEVSTQGLQLASQKTGTLAGADVPYGDEKWLKESGCKKSNYGWRGPMFGFPHLYNVERANPAGVWSADWALEDSDGLHFRLTGVDSDRAEVVLCDGKSPSGGSPYEMKWVLLHREGAMPVQSRFLNVMELYRGEPVLKTVRALSIKPPNDGNTTAVACVVELSSGRIDTIFLAPDAGALCIADGGFRFSGRFGLHSLEKDGRERFALIGGTELTRNGKGIKQESGEYRGEIKEVDRATETITVAPAPANSGALVGKYIFITNPNRRLAYKVLEAEKTTSGIRLRLEYDSKVGTGKVSGHADYRVTSATPFRLRGYRYYHGARLVNAAGTAEYRIHGIDGAAFIDAERHPTATTAKLREEFPIDTWFGVYDYGVGDEVVLPLTAVVRW